MILTEVLAKDAAVLTDEEKAFLKEHADILSVEEKEKFKDVLAGEEGGGEGEGEESSPKEKGPNPNEPFGGK